MADEAETIYELRDELARDAQAYEDAAARSLPTEASDDAEMIHVRVADDGVPTITVRDGWLSAYEPGELAGEIMATLGRLSQARLEAWAFGAGEALDVERRNTPVPPLSETTAGKVKAALEAEKDESVAITAMLERVLTMLDDIADNLDSGFDDALRKGQATAAGTSSGRSVIVQVAPSGDLRSIELSERWLEATSADQISREITAAIAMARDETPPSEGPLDGTALAAYQRFVDDHDAFVRFLNGKD